MNYYRDKKARQKGAVQRHRKRKNEEYSFMKETAKRLLQENQLLRNQLQKITSSSSSSSSKIQSSSSNDKMKTNQWKEKAKTLCQKRRGCLRDIW